MTTPNINQIMFWLTNDFRPEMGTGVDVAERQAKAAEYAAYHVGQINKKLDRLIALLEKRAGA